MKKRLEKKLTRLVNQTKTSLKIKPTCMTMALLPLAACGGGGGGNSNAQTDTPPAPDPSPTPEPADFTESTTNVFVALDNLNRTLNESGNPANLTVTGKAGNDSITTGSGADTIIGAAGNDTIISNDGDDLIRAGEGRDTVSAGAGNDGIVIIGTTAADEYTNGAISNSGGTGINLSSLINLADLNGPTVSEVVAGEIIDGGSGTNTLYIYGTVDLTGVTLNNVTILVVNSDVTLTPEQIADFTAVDGDGSSLITIQIPQGSSDNYILDLSTLNLSGVDNIHIDGNITVVIDDTSDLAGVNTITNGASDSLALEIKGSGGSTNVSLGDISDKFTDVDSIDLDESVILTIDDASNVTELGLGEITGTGDVETDGSQAVNEILENIEISEMLTSLPMAINDDAITDENQTITFDVLANDIDLDGDDLIITDVSVGDEEGSVSIISNRIHFDPGTDFEDLGAGESRDVEILYTISDGENNDQASLTVTVTGTNDAPQTQMDHYSIDENEVVLMDVLANDLDPDSELTILSAEVTDGTGILSIVDGKIQFDPNSEFLHLDDGETAQVFVNYTITDGNQTSDSYIQIDINGTTSGPAATNDYVTIGEDTLTVVDVLANDTTPSGDLTITEISSYSAEYGTLSIVDNKIQFEPGDFFDPMNDGQQWLLPITYTVSNGQETDEATLYVTIQSVSDGPEAITDHITIGEDTLTLIDVVANDLNVGDDYELTIIDDISEGSGILSIVDGKISFEPGSYYDSLNEGELGFFQFDYQISDGTQSDQGTVYVTLTGNSDGPIAVNDHIRIGTNQTVLVDVLSNDRGDNLSLEEIELLYDGGLSESLGTLSIVDNKIQFDPSAYTNNLSDDLYPNLFIDYLLFDGTDYDSGQLAITIVGDVETIISAVDDYAIVDEGSSVLVDVLADDIAGEGDLVLTSVEAITDSFGQLTIVDDKIQFEPGSAFDYLESGESEDIDITYWIQDANGIDSGLLTITVNGTDII